MAQPQPHRQVSVGWAGACCSTCRLQNVSACRAHGHECHDSYSLLILPAAPTALQCAPRQSQSALFEARLETWQFPAMQTASQQRSRQQPPLYPQRVPRQQRRQQQAAMPLSLRQSQPLPRSQQNLLNQQLPRMPRQWWRQHQRRQRPRRQQPRRRRRPPQQATRAGTTTWRATPS